MNRFCSSHVTNVQFHEIRRTKKISAYTCLSVIQSITLSSLVCLIIPCTGAPLKCLTTANAIPHFANETEIPFVPLIIVLICFAETPHFSASSFCVIPLFSSHLPKFLLDVLTNYGISQFSFDP